MLLVLDLDETLIHATEVCNSRPPDHVVFQYGVYLRPGLGKFLEHVANVFRVAVWTSSSLDYAEQVCALIFAEPARLDFLWARDRCTVRHDWERQTSCYAKRLRKLRRYGYDLKRVLVVDDSPEKHTHNYGNLVRIAPFCGDPADVELAHLARYLSHLSTQPNVRCIEKRGWRTNWASDAAC
jgi:carboxy-terminal domain RNA polymerase II polypeptide A small phosphatase